MKLTIFTLNNFTEKEVYRCPLIGISLKANSNNIYIKNTMALVKFYEITNFSKLSEYIYYNNSNETIETGNLTSLNASEILKTITHKDTKEVIFKYSIGENLKNKLRIEIFIK
ncbi:hypothetical protein [Cetobacterium sp.]|uniref:hypothetical protein n=1 Tax=Cetobacterium sp. TaxID=2071632 RepID=UPI003F2CE3E6